MIKYMLFTETVHLHILHLPFFLTVLCYILLLFLGRKYDPIECSILSKALAEEIKMHVKELNFQR